MEKSIILKSKDMKHKICFLAPLPPPYGGIANWTSIFTEYLKDENLADICVINTAPKGRVTEGRGVFERVFISGFAMFDIVSKVKKSMKVENIDCVHIATSGSLSAIRDYIIAKELNKSKIPFIYHLHFGRIPDIVKRNTIEWKLIKKIIKLSGYTIAIDIKTKEALMPLFGDKIIYLPNPLNIKTLPEPNENMKNNIIYLGWVIKQKGIEELVASFESIRRKIPGWKLKIVGPYKKDYIDELREKYSFDDIELLGERIHSEAMELINQSSIFVLPSYSEGCPYVIMEAMALKKVIIGTSVGNIPEMLSDNCGLLVQPQNKKALEAKLYEAVLCRDELRGMGQLAYEKIMKQYEIGIITKEILLLLDKLTEKRE